MTAAEVLITAQAAGVSVVLDGERLALEARVAPPPALVEDLARHKAEIIALLRPGRDGWTRADWQMFYEERAATAEYDAVGPDPLFGGARWNRGCRTTR